MNSGLDNAGKSTFLESAKTRFVKDYKAWDIWTKKNIMNKDIAPEEIFFTCSLIFIYYYFLNSITAGMTYIPN